MNSPKKLPDKPSDLIELALRDLELVELRPDAYKIDMLVWHERPGWAAGPCSVCFAGSVMAMTLGKSPEECLSPHGRFFDEDVSLKLRALNYFREGHINQGLAIMGFQARDFLLRRPGPYDYSPEEFKHDTRKMASDLREVGL